MIFRERAPKSRSRTLGIFYRHRARDIFKLTFYAKRDLEKKRKLYTVLNKTRNHNAVVFELNFHEKKNGNPKTILFIDISELIQI